MLLPIYAYGHPVLRKKADEIAADYPELSQFIANMWETMYHAEGVGLAAPQVGRAIRLFIIDTLQLEEKGKDVVGFKKVFINAQKVEEKGKIWAYEEGCLSIPDIRGDVDRLDTLTLRYMDENFVEYTETFNGINARVIQHEYDHTEGILFLEYLKPVKKAMIRGRLENIRKGKVKVEYKMKFA